MRLINVYDEPKAIGVLYALMYERPAKSCISHWRMPTRPEHDAFVASRPYAAWYLVRANGGYVGAVYLTHAKEIGIGIFRSAQRCGHAIAAIRALMELHPRERFLANINPDNEGSIIMFDRLGFRHIQNTYSLNA